MIEIWMTCVGALMAAASLPQVLRLYKRQSSEDISLWMWYTIGFGQLNWLAYGLYMGSISLVVTNILCIVMNITIIVLTITYRRRNYG